MAQSSSTISPSEKKLRSSANCASVTALASRGLFGGREVSAVGPLVEMPKLIVGPTEPARQDSVAGEAVGRVVDLAGSDDDEFLEHLLSTRVSVIFE